VVMKQNRGGGDKGAPLLSLVRSGFNSESWEQWQLYMLYFDLNDPPHPDFFLLWFCAYLKNVSFEFIWKEQIPNNH
jgi:hypothetical protein